MTSEKLYHLSEVAEKTGLSLRSLADAARAEKMPHHRIQGRRYMTQAQIDDYLKSSLVGPKLEVVLTPDEIKRKFLDSMNRRSRRKGL